MSQRRVKGPWELEAIAVIQSDDLKMNAKDGIPIPVTAENWTDSSTDSNYNTHTYAYIYTCMYAYIYAHMCLCVYMVRRNWKMARRRQNLEFNPWKKTVIHTGWNWHLYNFLKTQVTCHLHDVEYLYLNWKPEFYWFDKWEDGVWECQSDWTFRRTSCKGGVYGKRD